MGLIKFKHYGDFKRTERFFNRVLNREYLNVLDKYGKMGVSYLSQATPVDSGLTADSWTYVIERNRGSTTIYWTNTNENDGVNIALILQYGHGTGTGGYVKGIDYVNPAMKPVFDQLATEAWKEVSSL